MATSTATPTTQRITQGGVCWVLLGIAIAVSIGIRIWLNQKFQAPTILTDELTYSQLAENIANGNFSLSIGYGVVYPLLLAPSWALADFGTTAFAYMQTTNAVLVSLTALPVFLWAKRMMQPKYALLAAGLTLAMPSMAYSGTIMTENAFVLFFALAAYAIALAVERPTILNQGFVLVALALAAGTRAQAVVLVVALPIIIVLTVLAEERAGSSFSLRGLGRRFARFWPLAAVAALGLLAIVVRSATTSWHVSQLLQAYSAVTTGQYAVPNVARWSLWHAGEATFALGVFPVAAVLVMVGLGLLNRTRSPAERAFLCTAIVLSPLVIIQVAIFTSWFSLRVSERNMFAVFPIILIGLALWLDRGLARPRRITGIAVAIAGVLTLATPFGLLYQLAPSTETWAIVLPEILTRRFAQQGWDVQLLIAAGVAVALFVFGIVRPRLAVVLLPLLLVGYFAVSQAAVVHTLDKVSTDYRVAAGAGDGASWIDRALPGGGDVTFLSGSSLGPDTDRLIYWEMGFFNRLPIATVRWGTDITSDPSTGRLGTPHGTILHLSRYVVTPSSLELEGRVIADHGAFLLQEPSKPYALRRATYGMFADGWTAGTTTIDVFTAPSSASTLDFSLARTVAGLVLPTAQVTVHIGRIAALPDGSYGIVKDTATATHAVASQTKTDFSMQTPPAPYRIVITSDPTFSPTTYGISDPRELGVQASVTSGDWVLSR